MIEVVRSRFGSSTGVNYEVFERTTNLFLVEAGKLGLAFLRDNDGVKTDNYEITFQPHSEIPEIVQNALTGEPTDDCYVNIFEGNRTTDYAKKFVVHNFNTRQGVVIAVEKDDKYPPEIFPTDEDFFTGLQYGWVNELFVPGAKPEYAELAAVAKKELLDPESLPIRQYSDEDYRKAVATAVLSRFTIKNFKKTIDLYNSVADPERDDYDGVGSSLQLYHGQLLEGKAVELRQQTAFVTAAKHMFIPSSFPVKGKLGTTMYLNYSLDIAGINFHHKDDIAMAVEFGEAAQAYFDSEGIGVAS